MSIGSQELCVFIKVGSKHKQEQEKLWVALAVKKARGRYSKYVGWRTFLRFGKELAKQYGKEFKQAGKVQPWYCDQKQQQFTRQDLSDFASSQTKAFESAYKDGVFEALLPPKLQSKATRAKTAAAMAVADKQRNHSIGDHVTDEGLRPGGSKPRKAKKAKAMKKPRARKAGARRGGTVPSGAVKPHRAVRKSGERKCTICGRIHTKRQHWSHEAAPKGGKPGAYKAKRSGR